MRSRVSSRHLYKTVGYQHYTGILIEKRFVFIKEIYKDHIIDGRTDGYILCMYIVMAYGDVPWSTSMYVQYT